MVKRLVIVESPTKARTLERFLGAEFLVESSVGHVRDLPANASEVPAKYKGEPWARLGVNVNDGFKPLYIIPADKKKTIASLKKKLQAVDELYLATDEDREGEAISWHLVEVLQPKVPVKRMVFHEITKQAIVNSLEHTRAIDEGLVAAQESRRIIDRLYGYEVSPVLWKKVAPRLSAGRVQSVAIRMLVDRERARMRFVPSEFWDLVGTFKTVRDEEFTARLASVNGRRIAGGRDFDPDTGELKRKTAVLLSGEEAATLRAALQSGDFRVGSAEEKPFTRSPAPPFTTSTLQQEGNRKLRFDARRTMRAAQRLYENGFITYMRTDSVALSNEAIQITRAAIVTTYGQEYLPESPRFYRTKVKNAQEAHEAIRPAGDRIRTVDEVARRLGGDEARIYELIWKRTLACQMEDARGRRMNVTVVGSSGESEAAFTATGNVIDFPGFLRSYVEGRDDPAAALAEQERILPPMAQGEPLTASAMDAEEHVTTPPPRMTEATLVKALEESGIGRPSTYASIIETIQRREYSFKKGTSLVPTFTAFAVVSLMEEHLADLVDTAFTARMEDRLDAISRGEAESIPYLKEFYFGNHVPGLRPLLDKKIEVIDARTVCTISIAEDSQGRAIVVRVGRYGPYLQREDTTAPMPENFCPDEMTLARAEELLAAGAQGERPIGRDPESDLPVYVKTGRFGPYVQLGDADPDDKKGKPKMVSLLPRMSPETLTLEDALDLLSLPRTLGADADGVPIVAYLGRYGPYIKRGDDTRSLEATDDILSVGLDRALELLAKQKGRPTRKTPAALKVYAAVEALGGVDVKLMEGRYGPYVTDGDVNASLPKGADAGNFPLEEVVALIEKKRAAGPSKRGGRRKAPAKKKAAPKKKAAGKKKAPATKKAGSAKKAGG